MKNIILISFLFSLSFSYIIYPEDNSTLNTTHILFEWEQVPGATSYLFTIYNDETGITDYATTESLIHINSSFCNWSNSYTWYVCPIYADANQGECIPNSLGNIYNSFHISASRSSG